MSKLRTYLENELKEASEDIYHKTMGEFIDYLDYLEAASVILFKDYLSIDCFEQAKKELVEKYYVR